MMPTTQDILLYQSPDGQIRLDVQLDHDTVWLTQAQMSELSGRKRSAITKRLRVARDTMTSPEVETFELTLANARQAINCARNSAATSCLVAKKTADANGLNGWNGYACGTSWLFVRGF